MMRALVPITIKAAAERLSERTGRPWSASHVLEALAEHHFSQQEWRGSLLVSLPPGWPLVDAETGEAVSYGHRVPAKVRQAFFYLYQVLDGEQEGQAEGVPTELEVDDRPNGIRLFKTGRPVPAEAIRLTEADVDALAGTVSSAPRMPTPPAMPRDSSLIATIAALLAAWPGGPSKHPSERELEAAAELVGIRVSNSTIGKALKLAKEAAPSLVPTK